MTWEDLAAQSGLAFFEVYNGHRSTRNEGRLVRVFETYAMSVTVQGVAHARSRSVPCVLWKGRNPNMQSCVDASAPLVRDWPNVHAP